jgi:probable phosphoglycerate mutase
VRQATRIVAIRHGETVWNAEARLQGQLDSPLSARGRAQAARLADALRDEGLSVVISSDLGRAVDTARGFAGALGLPLATDGGLRERSFGMLEGYGYREIEERWPERAAHWRARTPDFAPPGGESLLELRARCLAAVERLAQRHAGQSIALVTHGGVLDCLYRAAVGIELNAPRTWKLGHAAINRLLHTGEGLTLVGWNDGHHLDDAAPGEPRR